VNANKSKPKRRVRKAHSRDQAADILPPKRLRMNEAVQYSKLSRAQLYKFFASGQIKSVLVKTHPGADSGLRMVDVASIDAFYDRLAAEQPTTVMGISNTKRGKMGTAK
jgi:hypothetical protein